MKNNSHNIELPTMNYLKAMFLVALGPWVVLISVWFFVAVSIAISFEEPASGAVLVCGALVAEITYYIQYWTKMNTNESGAFKLIPDLNTRAPIICTVFVNCPAGSGKLGALLSLAKDHEVQEIDSNNYWFYRATVARIEKIISILIVITAIFGTALWGYGHLIF